VSLVKPLTPSSSAVRPRRSSGKEFTKAVCILAPSKLPLLANSRVQALNRLLLLILLVVSYLFIESSLPMDSTLFNYSIFEWDCSPPPALLLPLHTHIESLFWLACIVSLTKNNSFMLSSYILSSTSSFSLLSDSNTHSLIEEYFFKTPSPDVKNIVPDLQIEML